MNARLNELDVLTEPLQTPASHRLDMSAKATVDHGGQVANQASYLSPSRFGVSGKNVLVQLLGGTSARPWLISMAAHSVLFLLLASIVSQDSGSGDEIVSINVSQPADDERTMIATLSTNFDRQIDQLIDKVEPARPSLEHQAFKIALDESSDVSLDIDNSSSADFTSDYFAKLQKEIEGVGDRVGAGAGQDGQQAQFFGISSQGTRFVFVIDSSRSMRGQKWTRACRELWNSLERLGNGQEFFVVFFDEEPHLMLRQEFPDLSMFQANADNVTKVKRWSRSVKLGPNTFPMESIHCALSLKPDAVFLLSDGEFQDESVGYLRGNNRIIDENGAAKAKVPVHCVAFSSEVGSETLWLIAKENDGQFRFVK